ncbi:hypothetical protein NQ315_002030 [Exocentrus adspersus]|uniref:Attractin/MKLN-like beta-propeller domain-containing protein n=1 Tax=Exocentrus adspersus TaxID=1586481 RepID=A0AAV8V9A4_9CUCU|nr:hypothetical protein NQ315_002030 [Exocentrus adspersus]
MTLLLVVGMVYAKTTLVSVTMAGRAPSANFVVGGYGHSASLDYLSGNIYVYGGIVSESESAQLLTNTLYSYDPNERIWTLLTEAPSPRYLHTATFTSDGMMMVFGGNTHNDTSHSFGAKCYSSELLIYDVFCDTWTMASLPKGLNTDLSRFGHSAVIFEGSLYIYGGFNGQMLSDLLREGHICILRRGWLEGKLLIELADDIVDFTIVPKDNFIIVATRRSKLACFTKRGQNLWSVETTKPITCICLVPVSRLSINLIAVGQRGGTVELYYGRHIVDYVTVPESPSTITFGQLGQEENVMVVVTLVENKFNLCERNFNGEYTYHQGPKTQYPINSLAKEKGIMINPRKKSATAKEAMNQF